MSKEKLFEMARINKDHAEKGTMTLVDDIVKIPAENYYNPERWKKEVEIPYAKEAAKYLGKNKIIFICFYTIILKSIS